MISDKMEDYTNLIKDVPERDKVDAETEEKLRKIRNDLINIASEIAKKRAAQFNNNDVYAYLHIEDTVLEQFFIQLFYNRHRAIFETLKQIHEESEKKYKVE